MIVLSPTIIGDLDDRHQGFGLHIQLDHPHSPVFIPGDLNIGDQKANDVRVVQRHDGTPNDCVRQALNGSSMLRFIIQVLIVNA